MKKEKVFIIILLILLIISLSASGVLFFKLNKDNEITYLNEKDLENCLNDAYNARAERRKSTNFSTDKDGKLIHQGWGDGVEEEIINEIYMSEIEFCYTNYSYIK